MCRFEDWQVVVPLFSGKGKGTIRARLTCTRFLKFHVACWQRPLALAGLNGPLAQQDFAFMLHNASHYLQPQSHVLHTPPKWGTQVM